MHGVIGCYNVAREIVFSLAIILQGKKRAPWHWKSLPHRLPHSPRPFAITTSVNCDVVTKGNGPGSMMELFLHDQKEDRYIWVARTRWIAYHSLCLWEVNLKGMIGPLKDDHDRLMDVWSAEDSIGFYKKIGTAAVEGMFGRFDDQVELNRMSKICG